MEYGVIFWGTSTDSNKFFLQQKRIITIMTGCECGNEPSGSIKCGEFLD